MMKRFNQLQKGDSIYWFTQNKILKVFIEFIDYTTHEIVTTSSSEKDRDLWSDFWLFGFEFDDYIEFDERDRPRLFTHLDALKKWCITQKFDITKYLNAIYEYEQIVKWS